MNVLVTGGAGFIGSHLSERLIAEKHHVWCLDNFNDYYDPAIKRNNIKKLLQSENYHLIEGDILDESLVTSLFKDTTFDTIVHLAARAGVRPSVQQPQLYQEVNIRGTINLLEQTKIHGIKKFVVASSSSVYGNNNKVPFSESDNVDHPISPYAATKKACELICYTYHSLYNISVSCLRFFTVYGPRQRPDMAIHKFTRWIDKGEPIHIYGDGSAQRDFTFITDIVDGITRTMDRCQGYNIYNLGESKVIKVLDLVKVIEKNVGKRAVIINHPPEPGDVKITYADISKARNELNYNPCVNVEEGIKEFVKWYREMNPA
jgi:UDP-glucuronate 4-epimerase